MSVGSPGASRIVRITRVRGLRVHGDCKLDPEAGPQRGRGWATLRLCWTTLKRAAEGVEVDPGGARWANINLEGTQIAKLNHLWHQNDSIKMLMSTWSWQSFKKKKKSTTAESHLLVFTWKLQWGSHFHSWITIFQLRTCSDNPPLYRQLLGGSSSCAFQISQRLWNSYLLLFLLHWQRLVLSDVWKTLTHSTQFKPDSDRLWAAESSQSAAMFKESFPYTHTRTHTHGRGSIRQRCCQCLSVNHNKNKSFMFHLQTLEEFNPSQLKLYMLLSTVSIKLEYICLLSLLGLSSIFIDWPK